MQTGESCSRTAFRRNAGRPVILGTELVVVHVPARLQLLVR